MALDQLIIEKRSDILAAASRHGARKVRVFGSMARGDAGPGSDVDFLVDLEEGRDLFDLGALLMDLQDLLQRKVDTLTEEALHHRIRDRILEEAVTL